MREYKTEAVTKTIYTQNTFIGLFEKLILFTKHLACTNLTCAYFHLKYIYMWFRNSVTATKQNQYYFV